MKHIVLMSLFLNVVAMFGVPSLEIKIFHSLTTVCMIAYLFYLIVKGDAK